MSRWLGFPHPWPRQISKAVLTPQNMTEVERDQSDAGDNSSLKSTGCIGIFTKIAMQHRGSFASWWSSYEVIEQLPFVLVIPRSILSVRTAYRAPRSFGRCCLEGADKVTTTPSSASTYLIRPYHFSSLQHRVVERASTYQHQPHTRYLLCV